MQVWTLKTPLKWPYTSLMQSFEVLTLSASSPKFLEWFFITSSGEIPSFDSFMCHYLLIRIKSCSRLHLNIPHSVSILHSNHPRWVHTLHFSVFLMFSGGIQAKHKCFQNSWNSHTLTLLYCVEHKGRFSLKFHSFPDSLFTTLFMQTIIGIVWDFSKHNKYRNFHY